MKIKNYSSKDGTKQAKKLHIIVVPIIHINRFIINRLERHSI